MFIRRVNCTGGGPINPSCGALHRPSERSLTLCLGTKGKVELFVPTTSGTGAKENEPKSPRPIIVPSPRSESRAESNSFSAAKLQSPPR